jgi:enoyl-CoA hydratase/carnithine racemase
VTKPLLRSEAIENTLVLTIDREESGNALSAETAAALLEAIAPFARSRSRSGDLTAAGPTGNIHSIILTGAGSKFFCAGGDIKRYRALQTGEQVQTVFAGPRQLLSALEDLTVPVIAAINGYALGGGGELLLACDLRVACECAQIGFPQARLGIIPGWHGIQRLARDIGHSRAMKLLLTGERLSAQRALELGMIHEVVSKGTALEGALQMARSLDVCAPLALSGAKQVLHSVSRNDDQESRQLADDVLRDLWLSEDHREAEAAFEEKRTPRFSGK